ncbi:hypothetical protein [Ralstonia phage RSP15]|uniref:hypothetical protein n=1 Tax=Ralstonia phage RSP15 TaxID=1785960 RepID=UPI00074D3177|nr:hypothetical protein BH754_gp051 [Ralstonia phage RSP15]BAU40009.1 hypothetical protein [Ralstonia phage RSP15]
MSYSTPSSFDFDDQLDSFIVFLKGQDEFKDFNFEGSAIRELIRLLAYNSQMRAFTNAFMFNELMFGSADIRRNVASGAAPLGYVPNSRIGASLPVTVTVRPGDRTSGSSLTLQKEATFFAAKDGKSYPFVPIQDYTVNKDTNGNFVFNNVQLKQGSWMVKSFVVQTNESVENFIIDDENIDITTLKVSVYPNSKTTEHTVWQRFFDGYDLGMGKNLYFLRENRTGLYEMDFGDGVVSARPPFGSMVVIEYVTTEGEAGNQISSVAPGGSVGGFFDVEIEAIDSTRSFGGAEREDIEVIRRMAPLTFAAGGRGVTDNDYVTIVKRIFPEAGDVVAYSGEFADPPQYGYTMVGIKPKNSDFLTKIQKANLVAELSKYNVGSITPIITDPKYTYIDIVGQCTFVPKRTILSADGLKGKITEMCRSYSSDKLEKFSSEFNYIDFTTFVSNIDKAITKAVINCTYRKTFMPAIGQVGTYEFVFGRSIQPNSVVIDGFRIQDIDYVGYSYFVRDDGKGNLSLTKERGSTVIRVQNNIGSVDYTNGIIKLTKFNPSALIDSAASVRVTPDGLDQSISASRDLIIEFDNIKIDLRVKEAEDV